jgi:hypothetical protein
MPKQAKKPKRAKKMKILTREQIYAMLDKEDAYAQGWARGGRKKDAYQCVSTGLPFTLMEWVVFAEKYLDEAKVAYANYTPDMGAVRIRLLKAASLLVSALQVHGKEDDIERLAGISSSRFPILHGGLATFNKLTDRYGRLDQKIDALKSEELDISN